MPVGTGTAIALGALSAGGALGAAAIGSHGAGRAASAQAGAAENAAQLQFRAAQDALAFQRMVWEAQQRQFAPWLSAGRGALGNLSFLMGIPFNLNQFPLNAPASPGSPGATSQGGPPVSLPGGRTVPLGSLGRVPSRAGLLQDGGFGLEDFLGAGRFGATPTTAAAPTANAPAPPGAAEALPGGPLAFEGGAGGGKFDPRLAGGMPIPGFETGAGPGPTPGTPAVDEAGNPIIPTRPPGVPEGEFGEFGSLLRPWERPFERPILTEDPGFQFRLNEGMKALERSASARGGVLSGGAVKELQGYASGLASQEYQNAYSRSLAEYQQAYNIFQQNQANIFNRLAAMSGFGQTAAGQLGSAGQFAAGNVGNILLGSAGNIGQALQNAAAARGSGYAAQGNLWGQALQGITGNLSDLLLLRALRPAAGAGAGG